MRASPGASGVFALLAAIFLAGTFACLRPQPAWGATSDARWTPAEQPHAAGPQPRAADRTARSGFSRAVQAITGTKPDQQRARQLMQAAEEEFQAAVAARQKGDEAQSRSHFSSAASKYRDAAKRWPDSMLEEDALFWAAEAHFFADRYPKATKTHDDLLKKYPNTRYMDKVTARQFAVAEYWLEVNKRDPAWLITPNLTDRRRPRVDTFGNALKVFDRIRLEDPTGKLSDDATMAAANASFTAGKYRRADTLYADLRESFPDSQHQFNAHLLGLKCKLLLYEGPDYDGTVLDEGQELVKRLLRLFPVEAEKQREYLQRALAEIRLKKAEREWTMAQYYDRRKEYAAARYYYEIVRHEYADTNLSREAQKRLEQIAELPGVPAQRLAWLANLFPSSEQAKPLIARQGTEIKRR